MAEDYLKRMQEAARQYGADVKSNADLTAKELEDKYQATQEELRRISDQQKLDNEAAINAVNSANEEAEKGGAQMILDYKNQMSEREAEAQRRIDNAQRAARWTGAGELAASIANMIAVGGYGASNQEYKSYSQEWMKKADLDAREHRARMDSMRDRQRALQERLLALKQGNAQTLANMRLRAGQDATRNQMQVANLGLTGAEKGAQMRYNAGNEAAKAGLGAVEKGTSYELTQRGQNITAENARLSREQRRDQHAAEMRAKGLNPDGSFNQGYYNEAVKAGRIKSTSTNGRSSGNNYDVTIGGQNVTLSMSKETYSQGVRSGTDELKRDIMRKYGFGGDWDDFVKTTQSRKVRDGNGRAVDNPLYGKEQEIISALAGRGTNNKADYEVIERYVSDNKGNLDEFNTHLYRVATDAKEYPAYQERKAEGGNEQAPAENEWDQYKVVTK